MAELSAQDRDALATECQRLAALGVQGIRKELYDRACEGLRQEAAECPLARALRDTLGRLYLVGEDCIFFSDSGLYHPDYEIVKFGHDLEPLREFVRLFDEDRFPELVSVEPD
jgi:hypothetical protein